MFEEPEIRAVNADTTIGELCIQSLHNYIDGTMMLEDIAVTYAGQTYYFKLGMVGFAPQAPVVDERLPEDLERWAGRVKS